MNEQERDTKVRKMRTLVKDLRHYKEDYQEDEHLPTEINRLILIVQGRIYELEEVDFE